MQKVTALLELVLEKIFQRMARNVWNCQEMSVDELINTNSIAVLVLRPSRRPGEESELVLVQQPEGTR